MREINQIERNKHIYQLDNYEEFLKGDWIKTLPKTEFVDISYKTNNNILIVNDMKAKNKLSKEE